MRTSLSPGDKIFLNIADEASTGGFEVEIKRQIGVGATCIVYEVYYMESYEGEQYFHMGILKEFFPLDRSFCRFGIEREQTGELTIPASVVDDLKKEKNRFLNGYKKLTDVRFNNSSLQNETSDGQWILEANNTIYLLFSLDNGSDYSHVKEESLYDIINMSISLTEIVGKYHANDLLHMDIKPENIFITNAEKYCMKLFDFDSVTKISDLHSCPIEAISFSREWAAPEVVSLRIDDISEASDLYSIGAIVFERVMHRMPEMSDKKNFAKYSFDKDDKLFHDVSPRVFKLLEELFKRTLCITVQKRFQKAEELLELLKKIRDCADPASPYLLDCRNELWSNEGKYVGRKEENNSLDIILSSSNFAFVRGIGGVGKTTFVKKFAYDSCFETVYLAKQVSSLRDFVLSIPFANVNDNEWITDINGKKDDSELLKYKLSLLNNLDKNTLIVVDNYDGEQGEIFNYLMSTNAKIVFTTRSYLEEFEDKTVILSELSNEDCKKLFCNYCDTNIEDLDCLLEIIHRNTLLVKLIASTISSSFGLLKIQDFIDKLNANSLKEVSVNIKHIDHRTEKLVSKSIYAHLEALFNISSISNEELLIMKRLSLITGDVITVEEYFVLTGSSVDFEIVNEINSLSEKGWIVLEENRISIHPMIAEVILENDSVSPTINDNKEFIMNLFETGKRLPVVEYAQKYKFMRMSISSLLKVKDLKCNNYYDFSEIFGGVISEGLYIEGKKLINKMISLCESSVTEEENAINAVLYSLLAVTETLAGNSNVATKLFANVDHIIESIQMRNYPELLASIFYHLSLHHKCLNDAKMSLSYLNAYKRLLGVVLDDETAIDIKLNEANTYYISGDYEHSKNIYLELEKDLENYSGDNLSLEKICVWQGLGLNYFQIDSVELALEYYEKIIDCIDSVLSKYSPIRCSIFNNLGLFYSEIGNFSNARKYYDEALEIAKKVYFEKGKTYIYITLNYADFLRKSGDYVQSRVLAVKAIAASKYSDEYAVELANAYNIVGLLDANDGDYDDALSNTIKSYNIKKTIYPENHIEMATCYNNIADIYSKLSNYEEAEEYILKALSIYEDNGLQNSYRYWSSLSVYGRMLFLKGNFEEALNMYLSSLDISVATVGKMSINTIKTLQAISKTLIFLKKFDEAVSYSNEAKELLEKLYPLDDYIIAEHHIAFTSDLLSAGEYNFCIDACLKALSNNVIAAKELLYNNLGVAFFEMNKYDEAAFYYDQALSLYNKENPINFGVIYSNFGVLELALGNYINSTKLLEKGIELYETYGCYTPNRFIAYVRCAESYFWLKEFDKTITVGIKAEKMIENGDNIVNSLVNMLYDMLSKSYNQLGEYEMSQKYKLKASCN